MIFLKGLKKFFMILFLFAPMLSFTVVNSHGGKNTKPKKYDEYVSISVNVHDCGTNTTDSTHEVFMPRRWDLGMLKVLIEEQATTKIRIGQFIFAQRYVGYSDTLKDLGVQNFDTIIALGDSKKFIRRKSVYTRPCRLPNVVVIDEPEQFNPEALASYRRESGKLRDLAIIKMELNPQMLQRYVHQKQEHLQSTSNIRFSSLNLDYEELSSPSEEPLPVTWQF